MIKSINPIRDYMAMNTQKVLKLRKKIQDSNLIVLGLLRRIRYNRLLFRCQSFFPLSKSISNDIVFPHGLSGVFISNGAIINSGCVIFQQVTIGGNSLSDSKNCGFPTIGKNCYIGAGAKIIGNVKIGDNVRVGANTVVTMDVPDNATVVGSKSRIIEHNQIRNNEFKAYQKKKKDYEK